ncbi:MAG: hypothetical protein H0U00_00835 [Actinobacteria bacterium]|nr:hypothetical protein [Actinomycetota bacterium]
MASESQENARAVLERILKRPLIDFKPDPRRPSPDYTDEHDEAFEMKRVTSEELLRLGDQVRSEEFYASMTLSLRWAVAIKAPTLYDKFRAMPPFPDDDEATIAAIETDGMRVVRKAEREAEHRAHFAGQTRETPRIRDLGRELEPHLFVLESAGITNTRGAEWRTPEVRRALAEVRRLTHDAICLAHEPSEHFGPGIAISLTGGYVRTGDPDTLAARVHGWLDSPLSNNLRESLWPDFTRRHGVLSFDSSEPEYQSAQDAGATFLPTLELDLPAEVDVLWCVVGGVLLRYAPATGWTAHSV